MLVLTVTSVTIFAVHGLVDYATGIVVLVGTAAGGYAGAHFAIQTGARWLKVLFAVMVAVASIKLLFF